MQYQQHGLALFHQLQSHIYLSIIVLPYSVLSQQHMYPAIFFDFVFIHTNLSSFILQIT